jgi:hypothetical protein
MPDFLGSNYSKYEERTFSKTVTEQDLILASRNPLVEALNTTHVELVFSKPFYHTVYDPKGKVDIEKSQQFADIFDRINFLEWAMVCEADSFNLGRGIAEMAYDKNPDTGWVEFTHMERRPIDTFSRPKDSSIKSTSQRFKGLYYKDGILQFDQTQAWGNKSGNIVSLNPQQVFSIAPALARFPDGPGHVESLIPILDGAQYSFNLIYVVMAEQINPKVLYDLEPQGSSDSQIVQTILNNNSLDKSSIPVDKKLEYPRFYDRQDILEVFKFFEKLMYRIVYPISSISGEAGGILDNSSNIAKEDIFFSYIDFHRQKIVREAAFKGNLILDINGYKKQGYRYALVPAPTLPRNLTEEGKIIPKVAKDYLTSSEVRSWINSCIVGIKLEDDFENQVGIKSNPKNLDPEIQNKVQKIVKGQADVESLWETKADQVV